MTEAEVVLYDFLDLSNSEVPEHCEECLLQQIIKRGIKDWQDIKCEKCFKLVSAGAGWALLCKPEECLEKRITIFPQIFGRRCLPHKR